MGRLDLLPCLDSEQLAASRRRELQIPRDVAAALGQSAVRAARDGVYFTRDGKRVVWRAAVQAACAVKLSIAPDAELPGSGRGTFVQKQVQVANETTLGASLRLAERGLRPLALNFANGIHPDGGFLTGARAQEEVLCRSSALYQTLVGDPMCEAHLRRPQPDSTDWAIYSPKVPVFRTDDGTVLERPWLLDIISCAAPYGPSIGQPRAGGLLQERMRRLLAIARAYGHAALVLGAWGCGACGNDAHRTASGFGKALGGQYFGAFSSIVFAIADWSSERRFLGPFRDVLTENG